LLQNLIKSENELTPLKPIYELYRRIQLASFVWIGGFQSTAGKPAIVEPQPMVFGASQCTRNIQSQVPCPCAVRKNRTHGRMA